MANTIVMRKGARVGEPDAESDEDFLADCFVNNGTYDHAADLTSKQCVLLGRTGSGKSAIIKQIARYSQNVIQIAPESLALNELASSRVLSFFEAAGVNLDPFYVLLWKHIFAIELLRRKYRVTDEAGQRRLMTALTDVFRRDKSKEVAVKYLTNWGDKFWLETEYRTSEFRTKLENKLESSFEVGYGPIKLGAKGADSLSDEQKGDVIHHGQQAVNEIQIRDLAKVISLLSEDVFPAGSEPYYICLDRLDEDWVQDNLRFKLLKALLETIKAFQQVRSVKIIISMRTDLMYSLFQRITNPGFQSEKYTTYNLDIRWKRSDLSEVLNRRVTHLFKHQYTGHDVKLHDILSTNVYKNYKSVDYILERTFFRPREAIAFLNRCIEKAEGQNMITATVIKEAEVIYSDERLTALCDEWRRECPNLRVLSSLLRGFTDGSEVGHLRNAKLESFCVNLLVDLIGEEAALAQHKDDAAMDAQTAGLEFLRDYLSILYRVGMVGLKISSTTSRVFSFHDNVFIHPSQIELTSKVYVHRAFWVTLGIRSNDFDTRQLP